MAYSFDLSSFLKSPIIASLLEQPNRRHSRFSIADDGSSHGATSLLKVKLRGAEGEENRASELLEYCKSVFKAEARNLGIAIDEEEMRIISEEHVLLFRVTCSNWRPNLIRFVNAFFLRVSRQFTKTAEMPTICTHAQSLYELKLVGGHEDLPLDRIQFGSIVNAGLLAVHWEIIGKLADDSVRRHTYNGHDFEKDCNVSFDYPKGNISIHYMNAELDPNDNYTTYKVRGQILVEMSSIRRILFDQSDNNETGNRRFSLILIVDVPAKLKVKRMGKGMYTPWKYRCELQRGRYPGEISCKEAFHDSKAIILEFGCSGKVNDRGPSSSLSSFFYDMVARLRHKTGKMIEYSSFKRGYYWGGTMLVEYHSRKQSNHNPDSIFDAQASELIMNAARRLVRADGTVNEQERECNVKWKAFRLQALLCGILGRGMEYRTELMMDPKVWHRFVEKTSYSYVIDEQCTLYALERVMYVITEGRPNCTIPKLFEKEYEQSRVPSARMAVFGDRQKKEGYWRIMKLLVTPTRILFSGYEVIMGNRVLNRYAKNENQIIRLSFRDDAGGPMRINTYGNKEKTRLKNILAYGITYAGRKFQWLGNSNSQFRDHGCYMMHFEDDKLSPIKIRKDMGDFYKLPNIPKMLARLGLVFTQGRPSEVPLLPSEVGVVDFDFSGGQNYTEKKFVFSDGVGRISSSHAIALSVELGLAELSIAFQIRFLGMKGLLCMDPRIDEMNALLEMMGSKEEKKVIVRPSMIKFEGNEENSKLEIVKFSSSAPAYLNRPFINILCQVSEKQSPECHSRVERRIHELLRNDLTETIQSLYVEKNALEAIKGMSFPFAMEVFTAASGFHLTTEPFFRSLLRANAKFVLQKQLVRMNIRLPPNKARMMFGVVDDTGLLQYGQIFCQYSGSMRSRKKQKGRSRLIEEEGLGKTILTGRTLITKNPCHSSGDVRMFEAVDLPALRHLVDVVVFPMHGPRPHPDEMAGSDLDGDEYLVCWDEKLFLERNEEASIFPAGLDTEKWLIPTYREDIDYARCEVKMAEFFIDVMIYGQPGSLCTAHLAISDFYGLESKPAESLATKISQTLDYQKSGIEPAKMTTKPEDDPFDHRRIIPAEKIDMKPDFLRYYKEPGYESRGILGEVFRETSRYEDAIDIGDFKMEKVDLDPSFHVDGWEMFKDVVTEELNEYAHKMKSILEHYGIATEEELLSGMIMSIKRRLTAREEDDGTLFTTNRAINGMVTGNIETAIEKFFHDIPGRETRSYAGNIMNIRRKVSAAYNVAYEAANASLAKGDSCTILLSFPWLFHKELLDIKDLVDGKEEVEQPVRKRGERPAPPLAEPLSRFIDRYSEKNAEKFDDFTGRFASDHSIVGRLMRENEDLARTTYVVVEWAKHIGGLSRAFGEEQLLSLFVSFALGEVSNRGRRRSFVQEDQNNNQLQSSKGELLLLFISFVASREFRTRSVLSFAKIGGGILLRGQWKNLSEITLPSFLSLVLTHRLDLPMDGEKTVEALREYESRVMLLPEGENDWSEVSAALQKVSGCKQVKLTKAGRQTAATVSAIGRSDQLRVLSSYIYPRAPIREAATMRDAMEEMVRFNYDRLMDAARKL